MKKLILLLLAFSSFLAQSQTVETVINVPYTTSSTPTEQALLLLPSDYGTSGSKTYPLLVFWHGAGEAVDGGSAGTGLAKIYNSSTAGGPAYFIEHGQWPASFTNPKTGVAEQFIVVTAQAADWNLSGDASENVKKYIVSHYRVDTNRIHYTGLSAGGMTTVENACQLDPNEDPPTFGTNKRTWPLASMVPMSAATNDPQQSWANVSVADSIPCWGFGDQNNDLYGGFVLDLVTHMNTAKSGYARMTGNPPFTFGHGGWMHFYVPTYTETFTWQGTTATMNIYQWMLLNVRSGVSSTTPTANAGTDQSITQPTSSISLTGSATAGTGHSISSTVWSQTGGPSTATITNGSTLTPTMSALTLPGTYSFLLTVTNNVSTTATDGVNIVVNSNSPVANAGTNQSIALPVNTVTLSGSASTGTITSYLWTQLSGPFCAITSPTSVTTTITGMNVGTSVFKLSLNGGVSTATVSVTVLPVQPCGPHTKYTIVPFSDSSYFHDNIDGLYQPGDTIVLSRAHAFSNVELDNFTGNSSCPLVIMNDTSRGQTLFVDHVGQTETNGIKLFSCTYVHVNAIGNSSTQYGFLFQRDANLRRQGAAAFSIEGRSAHIEVNNIQIHNCDIGFNVKEDGGCDPTLNYPSWIMDSILIHDCKVVGTWNEGMYIGNTSPDNLPSDPRPVTCNIPPNPDSVIFPDPIKNGQMFVYNNIVDSTGRGGIQISNAIAVNGRISQVFGNTIKHSGLNGDDAQGSNLTLGIYTQVYAHDNTLINALTWNFASVGACGDSILRFENNVMDSAGYLCNYPRLATAPDTATYNPATEPCFPDPFTYPYAIWFDTRTREYTNSTPTPGTGIRGHDSTFFSIKGNVTGHYIAFSSPPNNPATAQIEDHVPGMKIAVPSGDIICNNTSSVVGQTFTVTTVNAGRPINFSTNCAVNPVPCNCFPQPPAGFFFIKIR